MPGCYGSAEFALAPLRRRDAKPASEAASEYAGFGEAEQLCNIDEAELLFLQITDCELGTYPIKLLLKAGLLCRQFALRLSEANVFIKSYQKNNTMAVEQRFLGPGDVLVEAGSPVDQLFQLVDGALLEKGEKDMVIRSMEYGPVFIQSRAFFTGGVHPHRIVAKTSAVVVALGKSREEAIIRNFPELALALIRESNVAGG